MEDQFLRDLKAQPNPEFAARLRATLRAAPPNAVARVAPAANMRKWFAAAASIAGSTCSIASRIARTISGNPITAAANAAPVQRNASVMPNASSRNPPTAPRRPNTRNSRKPVTTGGRTSGRCTSALTTPWPRNRRRASSQATAIANGRLSKVPTIATLRLSATIDASDAGSMLSA